MRSQEGSFERGAKLTNFLFYDFLIEGLGAEQLAPKDRQKFSKFKRLLKFWISA
jgi:hypothetical protein